MHFIGSYTLSDCCICECIDDIIYYIRMISVVYCSVRTTSCNIITLHWLMGMFALISSI